MIKNIVSLPLVLCIILCLVYDFVFENYPEYTKITVCFGFIVYFVIMIIDIMLMNKEEDLDYE